MISVSGCTALVTGGSRGIGRAAALLLARAGADVALTYHTRGADAEAVTGEIRALGRRAEAYGGDLTAESEVTRIFELVRKDFPRLDLFVANAGIWPGDDVALRDMDIGRWRAVMAANLDAVFLSTRAALRFLAPGGRVVLVSSESGQQGEPWHAEYAATKGALIALVKSLAVECAPGIRVNAVAPGWVDTDMTAAALQSAGGGSIAAAIPLRRIPEPADIAGPILFLCSDLARHVTGEVLNVNGGSVLCG